MDQNGPTLVLEDDLDLHPHAIELLRRMKVRTDFDVIAIADFFRYREEATVPTAYRVWTVQFISLAAYVISPQGARKLYERALTRGVHSAWDWFVLRGVGDLHLVLLRTDPALAVHRCRFASIVNEQDTRQGDVCVRQKASRDLESQHLHPLP